MLRRSLILSLLGLLLLSGGSKVWARKGVPAGVPLKGYSMVNKKWIYEYRNARASVTQPYTLYIKRVDDKRPDYERDYERGVVHPPYQYTLDNRWQRGTTLEGQLTEVISEELRRSGIFQEATNTPEGADYILDTLVKHCYGKYGTRSPNPISWFLEDDYAQRYFFGGTTLLVTLKKKDGTVVMQKEYSEEATGAFRTNQGTNWMYVMLGDSLEKCIERMLKDVDSAMGGKGLAFGQAPPKKKEKAKEEKKKKKKKKKKD